VDRKVAGIFEFRKKKLEEIFSSRMPPRGQ
jgi:hypothetical protein